MNDQSQTGPADLTAKIARLVEERGWNQGDFARIAQLNRQTVRQILLSNSKRRLRNDTVSHCARALGLSVNELRTLPLERLLPRMHSQSLAPAGDTTRRLYDEATQPQLKTWLDTNPERAGKLSPEEKDELLSIQGTGGPLTYEGVEHQVGQIERKRKLIQQIHVIAGTEYIDLLEKVVEFAYERIQPYGHRT